MDYRKTKEHRPPLTGTTQIELNLGKWELTAYSSHVFYFHGSTKQTLTGASTEACDLIPRDVMKGIEVTREERYLSVYVPAGGRLYLKRVGPPEKRDTVVVNQGGEEAGDAKDFYASPV